MRSRHQCVLKLPKGLQCAATVRTIAICWFICAIGRKDLEQLIFLVINIWSKALQEVKILKLTYTQRYFCKDIWLTLHSWMSEAKNPHCHHPQACCHSEKNWRMPSSQQHWQAMGKVEIDAWSSLLIGHNNSKTLKRLSEVKRKATFLFVPYSMLKTYRLLDW